jgi:hypothetical protein
MTASSKRRARGSVTVFVQEHVTIDLDEVLDDITDEALTAEAESRGLAVSPKMRVAGGEQAEDIRSHCDRIERLVAPDQRIEAGVLLRELQHAIGLPRIGIPTQHKREQVSA